MWAILALYGQYMWQHSAAKQWLLGQHANHLGGLSIPGQRVWLMNFWSGANDLFFLSHL
jgi:hypothetical protein